MMKKDKSTDIMIDLETLGTKNNCPVISIGACVFDINEKAIKSSFYCTLDLESQIDSGIRVPDSDTIKWWMNQANAAKKVFKEKPIKTFEGLYEFKKWVEKNAGKSAKVWGNGSGFDISIMESLFSDFGVECPWKFYNVMDLRTFRRFIGKNKKVEKIGVNHNALDDAKSQAAYVIKMVHNVDNKV